MFDEDAYGELCREDDDVSRRSRRRRRRRKKRQLIILEPMSSVRNPCHRQKETRCRRMTREREESVSHSSCMQSCFSFNGKIAEDLGWSASVWCSLVTSAEMLFVSSSLVQSARIDVLSFHRRTEQTRRRRSKDFFIVTIDMEMNWFNK